MKRKAISFLTALVLLFIAPRYAPGEAAAPGILPDGMILSQAVRDWAGKWAELDYPALIDAASTQIGDDQPGATAASAVPLDGVTGPFLIVSQEGGVTENDQPFSALSDMFFRDAQRWEALAAADAVPVFIAAVRQEDHVLGDYGSNVTVRASVYRIYIIDGQGTLLGWDEVQSEGRAPLVLRSDSPRLHDQNPLPGYLDRMRYEEEAMVIEDGVLTAYRSFAPAKLFIPEGVTAIAEGVFAGNETVRRVVLPGTLSYIGTRAFADCENLSEVAFSQGLAEIGPFAFFHCDGLTALDLPTSLRRIGHGAFHACEGLERVALADGLEIIESSAFAADVRLSEISFPASLQSIGKSAFSQCRALKSVVFEGDGCQIDLFAFSRTPWLDGKTDDYVIAADSLIAYNGPKGSFAVPEGVRHISARIEDDQLTRLSLPEGVESVGTYAFEGCTSLLEIDFPQTLTHIGSMALHETAWLDALDGPITVGGGVFFAKPQSGIPVEIPEGVTCVSYLGYGSGFASPLVIPESCVCIEAGEASAPSAGGQALHIPQGVTRIDYAAFGVENEDTAVYCAPGSRAERWALEKGFEVVHGQ